LIVTSIHKRDCSWNSKYFYVHVLALVLKT